MGAKVASIRLQLEDSGFRRTLNGAVNVARSAGQRMGAGLRAGLSEGSKGGLEALRSGGSKLKDALVTASGALGTLSLTGLIADGVSTEAVFRKMAQGIERGTGEAQDWAEQMKHAQQVSDDLNRAIGTKQLGETMQQLSDASGDLQFARDVLKTVGTAAVASGEDLGQMANLAGELNEKFGVAADEMPAALNSVLSLSKRGGVEFEELASYVGQVGASAKQAGIEGDEGFARFLGTLNAVRDNVGTMKKAIGGVQGIIDGLSSGEVQKKAKATVGVDVESMQKAGASFDKIIATIVSKAKGDTKKLTEIFGGGSQLQAVQAIGSLGSTVEEIQAALDKAGKASVEWSTVQKQAADNSQLGPARLQAAIETMRRAFEKPEVTKAINDLAANLPALAKTVAEVVSWIVANPIKAGGLAVAGTFGKGFVEAALPAAIQAAFTRGGGNAAQSIAGALTQGGNAAGVSMRGAIEGAAVTAAAAIAVAAAIDQGEKLWKEAGVKAYDSEGKEVTKGDNLDGWDTLLATVERDLGELGEMVSTGGATTGAAQKKYEERLGIKSGFEENTEAGAGMNGRPRFVMTKEAREREDYEREVAALTREEDDDWNAYAKKNKIDVEPAKKSAGAQGPMADPAMARLFADMVGAKKLRVEVTNPEAIGVSGAGGGPPRPGHAPR